MDRDYFQEALTKFNDTNGVNWYGWKKVDSNGDKIPNDQRMTYANIKVIKDGATKPKQQAYVNDADNVEMPDTDVPQDQVSKDIKDGQVGKTGVEMEGVDGKVIPASILDKVKDMDSLKGLKPEQLMTVQKALGGIAVDGKFGPETMGAMQKYFDNANRAPIEQPRPEPAPVRSREEIIQSYPVGVDPSNPFPIIKQEGGFISKLMAYQNGGLV